jgi:YbbR domain-containing protein
MVRFAQLRDRVLHHRGTKLLSLFLALVSWYAIQAAISFETVVTEVPLAVSVDPGLTILDRSAQAVDVVFRGSQDDIRYLERDAVRVEADIRGEPFRGSVKVRLQPKDVRHLGGARAVAVRPDEVTLQLDTEAEKLVPVKADLQGTLPEGCEVEKVVCAPASVTLYAPRRRLNEIDAVYTAPIDLEGRSRSFKKNSVGVASLSDSWMTRMSPSNITVDVFISEHSGERELKEVPVSVQLSSSAKTRVSVRPAKVDVTMRGRAELLRNLQEAEVEAYVNCVGLRAGATYDLPVRVNSPAGTGALRIEPATVQAAVTEM